MGSTSHRRDIYKKKIWGFGLFIMNSIWPFVKILENSSENCIRIFMTLTVFLGLFTFHRRIHHIALLVFLISLNKTLSIIALIRTLVRVCWETLTPEVGYCQIELFITLCHFYINIG